MELEEQNFITIDDLLDEYRQHGEKFIDYITLFGTSRVVVSMKRDYNHEMEALDERDTKDFVDCVNLLRSNNIECSFKNEEFTIEEALNASRKLQGYIDEINNARIAGQKLSPLEKFAYAFDIVTQFAYANEKKWQSPLESRQLIRVLNGDKIVCVGFATMLKQICDGIGINCVTISLEGMSPTSHGHASCLVSIDDEKYGFHGTCISDPTFCSNKNGIKSFKYLLQDKDTMIQEYDENGLKFENLEYELTRLAAEALPPEQRRAYRTYSAILARVKKQEDFLRVVNNPELFKGALDFAEGVLDFWVYEKERLGLEDWGGIHLRLSNKRGRFKKFIYKTILASLTDFDLYENLTTEDKYLCYKIANTKEKLMKKINKELAKFAKLSDEEKLEMVFGAVFPSPTPERLEELEEVVQAGDGEKAKIRQQFQGEKPSTRVLFDLSYQVSRARGMTHEQATTIGLAKVFNWSPIQQEAFLAKYKIDISQEDYEALIQQIHETGKRPKSKRQNANDSKNKTESTKSRGKKRTSKKAKDKDTTQDYSEENLTEI